MWRALFGLEKQENLLEQAWEECYRTLGIAREMFEESLDLLRRGGEPGASGAIRRKDKQINKSQREIRRKVLTHCSLRGAEQVPGGMLLVSLVIDMERIGDNIKNILDLADAQGQALAESPLAEQLARIERDVAEQFRDIAQILKECQIEQAREIIRRHRDETRTMCEGLITDLVQGRVVGITPAQSASMALYLRYLKRISAHLKNLATSVVNPFDRIGYKEKQSDST